MKFFVYSSEPSYGTPGRGMRRGVQLHKPGCGNGAARCAEHQQQKPAEEHGEPRRENGVIWGEIDVVEVLYTAPKRPNTARSRVATCCSILVAAASVGRAWVAGV